MARFILCLNLFLLMIPMTSLAQNCINYDDYLHVISTTDIPAESGEYPTVVDIVTLYDTMFMAVKDKGILSATISADKTLDISSFTQTWSGYPRALNLWGSQLYAADGTAGLQVYDVSDASTPQWLAHIDTPGNAIDVEITSGRAMVLDDFLGLVIIDIHEVRAPHIITSLALPGSPSRIERSGDLLFAACGDTGLAIIDVSFPDMPRLVGVQEFSSSVRNISIGGTSWPLPMTPVKKASSDFTKLIHPPNH
jgi:hypothetical protein